MGLLSKLKTHRQNRKVERLVRDFVARPTPTSSEIADRVAQLPREIKRAHKLGVRRAYRSPAFKGITSSVQRQILAESVVAQNYTEAEHERERQRQEDERYGVGSFDAPLTAVKDRPGSGRVRGASRAILRGRR